jgi:hypothetical protein
MKNKILRHLKKFWKQYTILAASVLFFALLGSTVFMVNHINKLEQQLQTSQLVIHAKEEKIQDFDSKLGVSESNLRTQKALNDTYSEEIGRFRAELESKTKELSLKDFELKSREETIAALRGKTSGGTSIVVVDGIENPATICDTESEVSYEWQDTLKRFKLKDPNILVQSDETFTHQQSFRINGLVLSDSSGAVQVSKVSVEEVVPVDRNGVITYEKVSGGTTKLVESNFEYAMLDDQPKAFDWLAPITLRPVVGMNFPYFTPFVGMELVNLGRWVPYGNVGIVPSVSVDVSGLPTGDWKSLANSRVGVGVVYQFVPPLVSTNLGLGATLSVPMNRLNSPMLSIDLVVYLSDDLFPL